MDTKSARSLHRLRFAASRVTSFEELRAIADEAIPRHGAVVAAGIAGTYGRDLLAGRRTAEPFLAKLVTRAANEQLVSRERGCDLVGRALMNAHERLAFAELKRRAAKLTLHRVSDGGIETGWFLDLTDARAAWATNRKPPLFVESLAVPPAGLLAVRIVNDRMAVLLAPFTSASPKREALQ